MAHVKVGSVYRASDSWKRVRHAVDEMCSKLVGCIDIRPWAEAAQCSPQHAGSLVLAESLTLACPCMSQKTTK